MAEVWSGDRVNQQEAFSSIGVALVVKIVLVYLIMVALYNNFVYPFWVLFFISLAIVGAFFAPALIINSLVLFTIPAVIMLIGLVAKNAMILEDFTNVLAYAFTFAEEKAVRLHLMDFFHFRQLSRLFFENDFK